MRSLTGCGNSAPPFSIASAPCRSSSSCICVMMARLRERFGLDVVAGHAHPARGRRQESRDHLHGGGLAGPVRTQEAEHFAAADSSARRFPPPAGCRSAWSGPRLRSASPWFYCARTSQLFGGCRSGNSPPGGGQRRARSQLKRSWCSDVVMAPSRGDGHVRPPRRRRRILHPGAESVNNPRRPRERAGSFRRDAGQSPLSRIERIRPGIPGS